MCIHSPDNFSDHVPVFFELSIFLPRGTLLVHMVILSFMTILTGIKLTTSIEAYKICVQASLPTLSNELHVCSTPDCKSHLSAVYIMSCSSACLLLILVVM